MKKILLVLISLLACSGAAHADATLWTYTGTEGPANWGKLSPDYAMCDKGKNQSPINIQKALNTPLARLQIRYTAAGKDIVNNGHSIQVSFAAGNTLTLDNTRFELQQVHFHAPSENEIEGKSYPLEAHFVHADKQGHYAVIAVMFRIGKANPGLAKLWRQMPEEAGKPIPLKDSFKPVDLLPKSLAYYRYSGSLTTPPCTEGVRWLVLKNPVTASRAQIEAFEKAMKHHNNRPIQPLNARVVVK